MLQYLINVTDNTFIPAMIVALLLTLTHQITKASNVSHNVKSTHPSFIAAMVIGIVVALLYAVLKRNTGFIVREYYDLALLSAWLVTGIITLLLVWLQSMATNNQDKLGKLLTIFIVVDLGLLFALFMPNIFLYPIEFNVGMDSIFNTDYLLKWIGFGLAIVVILISSLLIYHICQRLSNGLVTVITSIAVIIFTLQSLLSVVQILIVRRFMPSKPWLMDLLIWLLSHVNFFIYLFMIISLLLAITGYFRAKVTPLVGHNPAEIRKLKAQLRRDRRSSLIILASVAFTAYTVTRARYIFEKGVDISPAEPISASSNGLIMIPLEQINDGKLHRYGYETQDSTIVRFIIIKKSENSYGVGLDACDICGASGYYQRGDQVVCSLCDVVMNIATIGFPGGCNPVPLKFDIIDGTLVIKPLNLEAEKRRFK